MSGKGRAGFDDVASAGPVPVPKDRDGVMLWGVTGGTREGGSIVEMQRRRLLFAIGEVVALDGLENASVGSICKRAGMSRRTFYALFDDREACLLAALEDSVERIAGSLVGVYERAGGTDRTRGWRGRIRAALCVLLESFDADPALARLCLVESLKAGPLVSEYRRRVLDGLSDVIDRGRLETKSATGLVPLMAESTVGGVLAVLHARVVARDPRPLVELLNPLMSMIVHPYLGGAAAKREREIPVPRPQANPAVGSVAVNTGGTDLFKDLQIRFTYRTVRVMSAIASEPGISNREVGEIAGVHDQGQISKLLRRLQRNGLVDNHRSEYAKGEPNIWKLTDRGRAIHTAINTQTDI